MSAGGGTVAQSSFARTEFSLAPNGASLRIYTGDASSAPARFYRVDNANVAASSLFNGVSSVGWTQLSNSGAGRGISMERFPEVNGTNKLQCFAVFEPVMRQVRSLLIPTSREGLSHVVPFEDFIALFGSDAAASHSH
jgi:hypothetical protein